MTLLHIMCTTAPEAWSSAASEIPPACRAAIWAELAGLGLVDDGGPTAKGRMAVRASGKGVEGGVSADGVKGRRAGALAVALSGAPRVVDFETWTAARREAFASAGLDCRSGLGLFMARTVSAAVPGKWADCKIFGGTKRGPRAVRVPRAEYWPGGVYPAGLVVVDAPVEAGAVRPWAGRGQSLVCNDGYVGWHGRKARALAPPPELELLAAD